MRLGRGTSEQMHVQHGDMTSRQSLSDPAASGERLTTSHGTDGNSALGFGLT